MDYGMQARKLHGKDKEREELNSNVERQCTDALNMVHFYFF